jgi:hypothetical protein
MSKILYAFGWFAVGMIASSFPFGMFSLMGIISGDLRYEMVWPCAGLVYGIGLYYHQRRDKERKSHGR